MTAALKSAIRRHQAIAFALSIAASAALGEALPSILAFARSVLR